MHYHQLVDYSSSNDSNRSNIENCFDTKDKESNPNTNPIDINIDIEGNNKVDILWLLNKDKDYPSEYYLNQEDEFDKFEYMNEDYSKNSCLLLDFIEE
jgi:hypothetical protein